MKPFMQKRLWIRCGGENNRQIEIARKRRHVGKRNIFDEDVRP